MFTADMTEQKQRGTSFISTVI